MNIALYLDETYLDEPDLEKAKTALNQAITTWLVNAPFPISSLEEAENPLSKSGITFTLKSKQKLKEPLNLMYQQAKTLKCEMVVAEINASTNLMEEVCYFGYEEGKPDLYEIANYLSL